MKKFEIRIKETKKAIKEAEYIIIGGGSGLSTAAGLEYSGKRFEENFKEFIEKYNFTDMYTSSFHDFKTEEERWAYWSKHIYVNRYNTKETYLYKNLFELVKEKDYFVITTNVESQFEKAGFKKEKIFEVQGNYGYLQCGVACHNKLYYNESIIKEMIINIDDCKIPEKIIPKCPICNSKMEVNIRKDMFFVQDKEWYDSAYKYEEFLNKTKNMKVLYIEIGVGFNTPGIIRFPFEKMVCENKNSILIRINKDYAIVDDPIKDRTILFNEDVNEIITKIRE